MERTTWKATWSRFLKTVPRDADVAVETPDHFLMLATKCMERLSLLSFTPAKFNEEQCKYLAGKLDDALQSAHSIIEQINTWYFSSASPEDMTGCLEIFKLLLLMGLEAEGFIQDCYKDEWIQNAIMLTNLSEHVASMGFNLELCTAIFSNRKSGIPTSLTLSEVTNLRQAVAEIVKEKANLDEMKLCVALSNVTRLRMVSSTECQLATFLLGRLKSARLQPGVGLPKAYEYKHSKLSMKSLKQMESLGKGASAIVHRAIWLGTEVAKKTFHGPSNPDFLREVSILAGLSHPNIVSLLGYTTDQRKSHLIMELMDGDLSTLMQERSEEYGDHGSPFSILEAFDLLLQIAEGMLYLHDKKIVHRDLKSHNILVKSGKAKELDFKHVQVKVADFGLSRTKEKSMTHSQQTQNMGTTKWMAPEMMALRNDDGQVGEAGPKYPFKSDVYSFGMVCVEILTGDVPFPTLSNSEVRNVVLGGGRPPLPALCPSRLRTLIEACWGAEASQRPHFGQICAELRHLKCGHLMTFVWAKVPRSFSLNEIRKMTNEFIEGNRFGLDKVYKGVMVDTGKLVLVERVQCNCDLLSPGIWLKVLPGLQHKNLMGYVGYCYENGERILVFEYMPNYTLAGWLLESERHEAKSMHPSSQRAFYRYYERDGDVTNKTNSLIEGDEGDEGDEGAFHYWAVRRNICLGVANGIHYLHTENLAKIIRRSINLRTIFLDANLKPKIGGFWRECSLPEPGSEKDDVYNYGVVLLEIVSRRIVRKLDQLQEWAQELYSWGNEEMIIDPDLYLQSTEKIEAIRFIRIAFLCIHSVAATRPDMARVVAMLQGNLDEEIKSLGLEHEREISQLQRRFASQAAVLA